MLVTSLYCEALFDHDNPKETSLPINAKIHFQNKFRSFPKRLLQKENVSTTSILSESDFTLKNINNVLNHLYATFNKVMSLLTLFICDII